MATARQVQLAHIAHDCWQERMQSDGWRAGPKYDARRRIHDALRPFEELSRVDQQYAINASIAAGALDVLATCLDYPRGDQQHTPFDKLHPGMDVVLVKTDAVEDVRVEPGAIGTVEEVSSGNPHGQRVVVRWPSGDRTTHSEGDDDLRSLT